MVSTWYGFYNDSIKERVQSRKKIILIFNIYQFSLTNQICQISASTLGSVCSPGQIKS